MKISVLLSIDVDELLDDRPMFLLLLLFGLNFLQIFFCWVDAETIFQTIHQQDEQDEGGDDQDRQDRR